MFCHVADCRKQSSVTYSKWTLCLRRLEKSRTSLDVGRPFTCDILGIKWPIIFRRPRKIAKIDY